MDEMKDVRGSVCFENYETVHKTELVDTFDILGYSFRTNGKGVPATEERTLRKSMGDYWRDGHINRGKSVSLRRKCDRMVDMSSALL